MLKVTELCLVVYLINSCESTLNLCESPNGYLEVEEGKQNYTFTCSGLTQNVLVTWLLDDKFNLGACSTLNSTCSPGLYSSTFGISTTGNTSIITVNKTADLLKNSSLLCQASTENVQKVEEKQCQFDSIIPAAGVLCSAQFNNSLWALTGQCQVAYARSSRGRYYCQLYQSTQKSPSVQSLVGNFTLSGQDSYVNRTCKITSPLPAEGNYSYNVVIAPGQVQVLLPPTGSDEIRRPSQSASHNCPPYVEENKDVNCSCSATDLGKPSGHLVWKNTKSSELRLDKVNRTQNEMAYTCSLMWNNTDVLRINYTLKVNYSSRVLTFKINNMDVNVNVSENESVTVVCKADGRPVPSISLFKVINNQELKIAVANDSNEFIHNMTAVTCEAAGSYICKSGNIIGEDKKYIQMLVFCAPRRLTNESYLTTIGCEETRFRFEMIAYPDPDALFVIYIGSSANDTTPRNFEVNISAEYQCTRNTWLLHTTTCDVIFKNQTVYSAGKYAAIFSNVLGNVSFTFEVKEELHPATKPTEPSGGQQISEEKITGPVVGGVIGGVVFAVLVITVIIFVVRRNGSGKKGCSRSTEALEQDFSEKEQNKETETAVDKIETTIIGSTTQDVYSAVVKKGLKPTATDSTDSAISPSNKDVTKSNKGKVKSNKTPGKGKKKGKGSDSTFPRGASEYETFGFDEKQGQKTKGAKEIERRNQALNYTIVVFDDTLSTTTPPPRSDTTLYAEIVPQQMMPRY